jgi:hypothetical protein
LVAKMNAPSTTATQMDTIWMSEVRDRSFRVRMGQGPR